MGKVVFNMTMSLDGFVAGPNDSPENGLGDGGDRLFDWYFSGDTELTWCPSCWETVSGCSITWKECPSSWKAYR